MMTSPWKQASKYYQKMKKKVDARKIYLNKNWAHALNKRSVYLCHEEELYLLISRQMLDIKLIDFVLFSKA